MLCVCFSGAINFLELMTEMKAPKQFPKSLIAAMGPLCTVYLAVVVVAYGYEGQNIPG